MAKVQQTLSITIDDQTYDVAALSDQVKQMVDLMDTWRQKEADTAGELIMVRSAIRDIQNSLLATIRQEQAAAAAAAAAVPVPAPAPAPKKQKKSKAA